MKFNDIELEYKEETYTVKANKVFKLYRDVSPMAKMQYFANVENTILDEPFIFSDAYCKALSHAGLEVDEGEVLEWMEDDNYHIVLSALNEIKMLFKQPEKIQKKTSAATKKKRAPVKRKK